MVYVQMGQDNFFDVARPDAKPAQLRTDFLFTLNFETRLPIACRDATICPFQVDAPPGRYRLR